jgi:hypothetical protein
MHSYDIRYQSFRRAELNKYREMDPDVLVAELDVDTEKLIDALWHEIETKIKEDYEDGNEEEDQSCDAEGG